MLEIGLAGAFLGGALTLISPCSALVLPAFFAYTFRAGSRLMLNTGVFLAGLVTLLVPLGTVAGLAAVLVVDHRQLLIQGSGGLLILFGLAIAAGYNVALVPERWRSAGGGEGLLDVYVLGMVYGIAGACTGPILGAVLTMAAATASPVQGALLLFVYGLGMVVPLFVLAYFWERWPVVEGGWLRGRRVQVGPWALDVRRLAAGALFAAIGAVFIVTGGLSSLEEVYAAWGLLDLSFHLQGRALALGRRVPDLAIWAVFGVAAGWLVWRRRSLQGGGRAEQGSE